MPKARSLKPSVVINGRVVHPPFLPNLGSGRRRQHDKPSSKWSTPASILIDYERSRQGIVLRWNWKRYIRLANFLGYTPAELASVICMPHFQLTWFERDDIVSGPAALLLTMLEYTAMSQISTDVVKVNLGLPAPDTAPTPKRELCFLRVPKYAANDDDSPQSP